jgi:small-conductance mechanosensitive channel
MPVLLQGVFAFFAATLILVGFLMMVAPTRFPRLYEGFLRESVMQRETTPQGRRAVIRMQGLIGLSIGAFFAMFVWALR